MVAPRTVIVSLHGTSLRQRNLIACGQQQHRGERGRHIHCTVCVLSAYRSF